MRGYGDKALLRPTLSALEVACCLANDLRLQNISGQNGVVLAVFLFIARETAEKVRSVQESIL